MSATIESTESTERLAVTLPQLGETVTEATVTRWLVEPGATVTAGQPLFEVATDKVDTEVPAESDGVLVEILVPVDATAPVGATLAYLAVASVPALDAPAPGAPTSGSTASESSPPVTAAPGTTTPVTATPVTATPAAGRVTSPLVRQLLRERGLAESDVTPSGLGGRITRADVLAASSGTVVPTHPITGAPIPTTAPTVPTHPLTAAPISTTGTPLPTVTTHVVTPAPSAPTGEEALRPGTTRIPLSRMRRVTGARLHESVSTIPHVLSVVQVDLAAVEQARQAHRDAFKARHGFSLTYLPFIVHALADALRSFPEMNAHYQDDADGPALVTHRALHLGLAVDLDHQGLVVPTLADADGYRLELLATRIHELASAARTGSLAPSAYQGGTFTVSNNGSAGSHLTAAIINPPQVAILSTDAVRRVPVAVTLPTGEEVVVVHPVCNLSLSWDHRAFDGAYAAGFLAELARRLETRDWAAELR